MKYVADGNISMGIDFTNDVKFKEHMLRCLNEKLMYDVIEPILSNEDKSPVDYILTVHKHDEEPVSEYNAKKYRKSIEVDKITRCKDCEHCYRYKTEDLFGSYYEYVTCLKSHWNESIGRNFESFFCADGTPRDEAKED